MKGTWQTTSGGRGGLVLAAIVAAIALGSGTAAAAVSAVVTILIVLGSIITAAVLGVIAWLVHLARQDRPGQPIAARPVYPKPRPDLPPPCKPATGPGRELHIHLHGLTPEQLAAVVTRSDAYLEEDR